MPELKAGAELDARVAEKVMGWTLVGSEEQQKSGLGQPPGTSRYSSKANYCPPYSTDIAADYEVLKVARCWPFPKREAFCQALLAIWRERRVLLADASLEPILYQPGDYSLAALAAVEATTPDRASSPATDPAEGD